MKIKGWDKISGYTYKGMCIVNPIHNADETKYMADVINLNLPQKPKWELNVLMNNHKFKQDDSIDIMLWDENKYSSHKSVSKNIISTITAFRILAEEMIDEILKIQLISAPTANSHSINSTAFKGTATIVNTGGAYKKAINPNYYGTVNVANTPTGIINTIYNNGTTTQYIPTSSTQNSMLMAIKDLQEQIDNLKNNNANN